MKSRSTNELPSAICSENGPFDVTHRQNFWRSANVREGWLADTLEKRIPRPLRSEENLPLWLSRLLINNSSPRSTINEMDNKWTSPRAREVTLVAETWLENNPSFERKFTHVRYERFDRDRGTTSSAPFFLLPVGGRSRPTRFVGPMPKRPGWGNLGPPPVIIAAVNTLLENLKFAKKGYSESHSFL